MYVTGVIWKKYHWYATETLKFSLFLTKNGPFWPIFSHFAELSRSKIKISLCLYTWMIYGNVCIYLIHKFVLAVLPYNYFWKYHRSVSLMDHGKNVRKSPKCPSITWPNLHIMINLHNFEFFYFFPKHVWIIKIYTLE